VYVPIVAEMPRVPFIPCVPETAQPLDMGGNKDESCPPSASGRSFLDVWLGKLASDAPWRLGVTLDDFRQSLAASTPPAELTFALVGLWWDAKGEWMRAHESAQQDEGAEGSWVHAYLHRKEGDQGNAAYWYRRAGKPVCRESLDAEWLSILKRLLGV